MTIAPAVKPIVKRTPSSVEPPSEAHEQALLCRWLDSKCLLYCASTAELLSSIGQRAKARDLGYKKGFPDLFIFERRGPYGGMAIELKRARPHSSTVSKEQSAWLTMLKANGYYAVVCYGHEEAIDEVRRYLADVKPTELFTR